MTASYADCMPIEYNPYTIMRCIIIAFVLIHLLLLRLCQCVCSNSYSQNICQNEPWQEKSSGLMYFNICDPGHIPARDVCICSDHMRKWRNLCYLAATLTYIRAWAHENAVNQYHIRVRVKRIGNSATVDKTKLTLRQKRKPYPHRDESWRNSEWSPTLPAIRLIVFQTARQLLL